VTMYLKEGVAEKTVSEFIRELESSPQVRSVRFISKDMALELFRDELGARGSFLEGLDENNPLPASVDLVLQPDELNIDGVRGSIERYRSHPAVDEVIYGSEWVEQVQKVLNVFRLFGYVTLFVVLLVIVFLIANTIKLVIYSRRDEIEIMQLVGATRGFVRIPFVIGGVVQGLLGSVLGLILLKASYALLNFEMRHSALLGAAVPELLFLSPVALITIILVGLLIGAIGSYFALGRFMKV